MIWASADRRWRRQYATAGAGRPKRQRRAECASPALGDDHRCDYLAGMSPPPKQPPASSPAKPKLIPEECRAREVDRLADSGHAGGCGVPVRSRRPVQAAPFTFTRAALVLKLITRASSSATAARDNRRRSGSLRHTGPTDPDVPTVSGPADKPKQVVHGLSGPPARRFRLELLYRRGPDCPGHRAASGTDGRPRGLGHAKDEDQQHPHLKPPAPQIA
jgi:hypothetical protein